jgi:hypothetical protein
MTENDEARMTSIETMTKLKTGNKSEPRFSSFVIRRSFVLRHSSFVIFARLLLVLLLALGVSCTPGKRITRANVDEVAEGMSKKQVESILGPPTSINSEDLIIMKKTTYIYRQGKDTVTIVFKDDKVQSKDSTLAD